LNHHQSFEDFLASQEQEVIYYQKLEEMIEEYFGIDQITSSMIVSHFLNKNHHFICVKKEHVLETMNPDRVGIRQRRLLERQPDIEVSDFETSH